MTERSQFVEGLITLLEDLGVDGAEIERARSEGETGLVALFTDEAFIPGEERLTRHEVEERAGVDPDEASAFWRAIGFADVPEGERTFSEVDVEMMERVRSLLESGLIERDVALQNTRVMGRAMAQIAASLVDTVRTRLSGADAPPPVLLGAAPTLLDNLDHFLIYIWRRHFAAEVKRAVVSLTQNELGSAIVGFADLVGFTAMSRQLDADELAHAVSSFEATAVDRVGAHGGRIIKMIGDEVMFEAPTPKSGAAIALDLVDAFANDDLLPDVRAGLAAGTAIRTQGDIFGDAANLASRLVEQAYPATILVSDAIAEDLKGDTEYEFRAVLPRNLKGFGRTKFWVLRRTGAEKTGEWRMEPRKLR